MHLARLISNDPLIEPRYLLLSNIRHLRITNSFKNIVSVIFVQTFEQSDDESY